MQDPPPTGDEAVTYFFDDVIGMSTLPGAGDRRPTRLVGKNVGYSFFAWLIIYVSILCVCVLRSNYSSRSLFLSYGTIPPFQSIWVGLFFPLNYMYSALRRLG
jgi:hypothetical protein